MSMEPVSRIWAAIQTSIIDRYGSAVLLKASFILAKKPTVSRVASKTETPGLAIKRRRISKFSLSLVPPFSVLSDRPQQLGRQLLEV